MQPTGRRAFVLGSGIAGLSLSEILSRNGWEITLFETAPHIGGDASRSTQNWLHTGWLYAALPSPSAMNGCARSLRLFRKTYARVLPRHVVNVEAGDDGVTYPPSHAGWFSDEAMHYIFAVSTYDLSPIRRLAWSHYLDAVLLRRLRCLGYPTQPLRDLPAGLSNLLKHWEGDDAAHARYRVVRSTDARIHTKAVLSSLASLLGEKAEVVTEAEYELVRRGSQTSIRVNGELHTPDLCVLAAGKSIPSLLAQIGAERIAKQFKSIASPIVVLKHALDLPNFIRFTPNLPETINHVKYCVDGSDVSTIGSYDYHPVDMRPDIRPFAEKVCRRLAISSSDVVGSYYGTKTELTGKVERRYNHAVEAVNENTFFAIAGKFSQFPLLVNEFADRVGLRVDIGNDVRGTLPMTVAETAPERIVREAGLGHKNHAA